MRDECALQCMRAGREGVPNLNTATSSPCSRHEGVGVHCKMDESGQGHGGGEAHQCAKCACTWSMGDIARGLLPLRKTGAKGAAGHLTHAARLFGKEVWPMQSVCVLK
jgi:hypothetical protein